jgi:lipopolysaccharide assembly outer membrane protein LptD (OstA)
VKRALLLIAAVALMAAGAKTQAKVGEWNMATAQLNANLRTGAFSAPQHVTLTRQDGSVVTADRATGNYRQKQASLYGHVSVHDASGTFGLKSAQKSSSRGPATLTADQLQLNDTTHIYDASGNVHYEQGDTTADAQTAHLNDTTHELQLTGKVHVVQGDRKMDADSAVYNTQTGDGTAQNNVTMTFPGVTPSIATPKPITIKGPAIPRER